MLLFNDAPLHFFSSFLCLLSLGPRNVVSGVAAIELSSPTPSPTTTTSTSSSFPSAPSASSSSTATTRTASTVLPSTESHVVRSIFLPYVDVPGLGASVLSVGTGLTVYVIDCMTTTNVPTPTSGCGLDGTVVVTEGPGTFIATLTPSEPVNTAPRLLSTDSDTTSAAAQAVTGTTVSCTFSNRPAALRSNAVYSHLPVATTSAHSPSSSQQAPFPSSAALEATWVSAICIMRSTIADLGIAESTTTLIGSTLENYGSAPITITAGAAKLTSTPRNDAGGTTAGAQTSSNNAAGNRFNNARGEALGLVGALFGVLGVFGL